MTPPGLSAPFCVHHEPGVLFVLEGTPGAGKTTSLRYVAKALGAVIVPELNHLAGAGGDIPTLPFAIDDWYLDTERGRQLQLKGLLKEGHLVIQDRCFLSTLAFVYASESGPRLERLLARAADGDLFVAPDVCAILHTDVGTSLDRRHRFRGTVYQEWFVPRFLSRYHDFYRLVAPTIFNCQMIDLDTTLLSPPAVADTLTTALREATPRRKASA